MKKFRNLKHIFVIILISLSMLFSYFITIADEFNDIINGYIIYRTLGGRENTLIWQDYFHKHTLKPSSKDIIIIKIDERTLNGIQSNPNDLKNLTLTKKTYSDLVKSLEGAGVKGIAFDIVFQNADPISEQEFANTMKKYNNIVIGAKYIEDLCQQRYGEIWTQLGTLKKDYPQNISSSKCDISYREIYKAFQSVIGSSDEIIQNNTINSIINSSGTLTNNDKLLLYCDSDSGGIIDCPGLPRSIYKDTTWGIINTPSSYKRTLSAPILEQPYKDWKIGSGNHTIADTEMYPLAMSLYTQTNTGASGLIAQLPYNLERLERIIQDENGEKRFKTILQPYFSAEKIGYPEVSLIDVLKMSQVERVVNFKGKYVFVGEGGTLIHDEVPSPVTGGKIDGVETHAHFLDGLIQNKMISRVATRDIWVVSIFLTIFTILCYFYLPSILSLTFAIVIVALTLWTSRYLYDVHRILVDFAPLFLSVFFATWITTYSYRFFVVDREKRYIENAFGHYIDPKMVEMIDMEEVSMTLGGEVRELSVFFSDIAGFTTISEKLGPKALFWLMSLYLSRMTDILKQEGGTLDKYIGDAVMGFFGAPIAQSDHAIRACRTALNMRRILPEINSEINSKGMESVNFRVGIATGDVMIGNIGSQDHFNYTVLGDTVNLASRLEASGKEYDVHIIISEGTRLQIGDGFELRELDAIAVKGKTEGVKIYELLGYKSDKINRVFYDTYEQGLMLYRAGKYVEAGKIWDTLIEVDPVSRVMMLRCIEIIKGNIQVENGIYHMTHK